MSVENCAVTNLDEVVLPQLRRLVDNHISPDFGAKKAIVSCSRPCRVVEDTLEKSILI